jgi:hypothetical protein
MCLTVQPGQIHTITQPLQHARQQHPITASGPQVNAIETGADALTAVVFHSFHLLLISVDSRGYVRVNNGADGNLLNAFHVSKGEQQEQAEAPTTTHTATVRVLQTAT